MQRCCAFSHSWHGECERSAAASCQSACHFATYHASPFLGVRFTVRNVGPVLGPPRHGAGACVDRFLDPAVKLPQDPPCMSRPYWPSIPARAHWALTRPSSCLERAIGVFAQSAKQPRARALLVAPAAKSRAFSLRPTRQSNRPRAHWPLTRLPSWPRARTPLSWLNRKANQRTPTGPLTRPSSCPQTSASSSWCNRRSHPAFALWVCDATVKMPQSRAPSSWPNRQSRPGARPLGP